MPRIAKDAAKFNGGRRVKTGARLAAGKADFALPPRP